MGHGFADYQYGCTYKGKCKQGADTGHFACHFSRNKAGKQADYDHEQQIAM